MRITNKIMQNNSLSNINVNKISQDKLSTMMGTQKKITRPSDDPIIAIRALRLRSSVSQITQYYEKNVPDAKSWLEVTEDSLDNVSEVLTEMIRQVTKGASETLKTVDREAIISQLAALRDELYATGDADYAGRFVFTGYRTDTSLSFDAASDKKYSITEQLNKNVIDQVTKVDTVHIAAGGGSYDLTDVNDSNYNTTGYEDIVENDITSSTVYRIRLAYSDCSKDTPKLEYTDSTGAAKEYSTDAGNITVANSYDIPSPYEAMENETGDKMIFLADTGELLMSETAYKNLAETKDDVSTSNVNEGEIRITYSKDSWEKGDLRPEHYFACTDDEGIKYNEKYLDFGYSRQSMEYDVGFNQTIQINTTADEVYTHDIGREIDDLIDNMQQVVNLEKAISSIEKTMEALSESDPDYDTKKKTLQNQLDAANKAYTLAKKNVQTEFTSGITAMQGYLDQTNLAITNCGTRGKKLELIESRLMSQQTTFETLQSENEDVDITEVAIKLNSAELTYQASLMATGKIMQTSLLNFI